MTGIMLARRSFVRLFPLAAAGWGSGVLTFGRETPPRRIRKNGMHYRLLGRTGLFISEIALGGSPLPDWPLLLQIIERGVNYIDTSPSYGNGNSERQAGRLLKTVGRDKIFIGTKFSLRGNWSEQSILRSVEGSLLRLGAECIDVLLIHGVSRPELLSDTRVLEAFDRLKKDGKCRFTGLSCHENHLAVVGRAVECDLYDMILVGYNVFDVVTVGPTAETRADERGRNGFHDLLRAAAAKGIGVIAMKTLKSVGPSPDRKNTELLTPQQAMLKWVLDNKNVASVVTEILNEEEMEQDLAVAGAPLTAAESGPLYRYVALNSRRVCRSCAVCRSACPERLPIPGILRALAYAESYGKMVRARKELSDLGAEAVLERCRSCGRCETACPYGVEVRSKFRAAQALLPA